MKAAPLSTLDRPVTVKTPQREISQPSTSKASVSRWGIFVSTFITIFLAEMGDKTQIATLLMTAQSHAPWVVFAGAGSALVATSLVGVLLGRWIAKKFTPQTIERSAAVCLLFVAAMLLWEICQG